MSAGEEEWYHKQFSEMQKKKDAEIKTLKEHIEYLLDEPQGCTCPNNGGGDCDWCMVAGRAKDALQDLVKARTNNGGSE